MDAGIDSTLASRPPAVDPGRFRQLLQVAGIGHADAAAAVASAPSLQTATEFLASAGVSMRVVLASPSELRSLPLPALVALDEGVAVVTRLRAADVEVCTAAGATLVIPNAEFRERSRGLAFDLTAPMSAEGPLPLRMLRLLASRSAWRVVLATIPIVALGAVAPSLGAAVIDRALAFHAPSLVTVLILCVLVVTLHREWFTWLRNFATVDLAMRLERALVERVLSHILRIPLLASLRWSVGDRLQMLGSAQGLAATLSGDVVAPLVDGATGLSALVFLGVVHPALAGAMVAASLVIGACNVVSAHLRARHEAVSTDAFSRQNAAVLELVRAIETLKATATEGFAVDRWHAEFTRFLASRMAARKMALAANTINELATNVVAAGLLYWLGRLALDKQLSNGLLVAEFISAQVVLGEASSFFERLASLGTAAPHYGRVQSLLAVAAEPEPPRLPRAPTLGARLVLNDVWFRYSPESPWVLEGVSLEIDVGAFHQLTGGSGSGKTTLLRLVAGLIRPERGSIRIAGVDSCSARDWITYLPQDAALVAGTVLENLRVVSGGASMERILAAAQRTGLDQLLASWPAGFETRLGPRGEGVSGGQQQLIALTGALASERPVLLLDEATSRLDHAWRQRFEKRDLFAGKTVVVAIHDAMPEV